MYGSTNNKNFYKTILMAIILLFLLYSPSRISATGSPPTLAVDTANIKVLNNETVITGTVSDDLTPNDKIKVEIYYSPDVLIDTVFPSEDGKWTFLKELPDGVHSLLIKAYDNDEIPNPSNPVSFSVDAQRPYISEITVDLVYIEEKSTTILPMEILRVEDITRVSPLNSNSEISKFKLKVVDNSTINSQTALNPVVIFSKTGPITGSTFFDMQKQELIFTPDQQLKPSTTYYLMLNPGIINTSNNTDAEGTQLNASFTDNVGNTVFPIIKKFTTVSDTVNTAKIDPTTANWKQNPHGYYTNNVNTCSNCHGTHVSINPKLDKPVPGFASKESPIEKSYCMACHDGTTTAPLPENLEPDVASRHDMQLISKHSSNTGSCTACHNPHLNWSEENPNLLKDHFVYQHMPNAENPEVPVNEVDSNTQLCETCHGPNTKIKKDSVRLTAYKVLHYRKSSSATGQITRTYNTIGETTTETLHVEDYDLCFSCHNSKKETEDTAFVDIFKYYQEPQSKHSFKAKDNSILNGPFPCAECHETHASKNIKLLKSQLGHEKQDGGFSITTGLWDTAKERQFCLKCHNDKGTALFGVVAGYDASTISHSDPSAPCSKCHTDSYDPSDLNKGFMEAAHAPKSGVIKP